MDVAAPPRHRGDPNSESIFSTPLFGFLSFFGCFSCSSAWTGTRTVSTTSASDATARGTPLVGASPEEPGLFTETVDSYDSEGCPSVMRTL